jgi:hypothetical protein
MFKLEHAIANWRQQQAEGGTCPPEVLDELESHLNEEIRRLLAEGITEADAFKTAVSRLGNPKSLTGEFRKLTKRWPLGLSGRGLLGSGVLLALIWALLAARWPGKSSPLLLAHILTLSVGDVATFFAGALGICYVFGCTLNRLSSAEQRALSDAAALSNLFAAGLVVAGLVLGMIWSVQNRGNYFSADPREIGTICAALWLIGFCVIWRFGQVGVHTTMLLCLVGNLIMCLAWFGAGLASHHYGIGSSWQLNAAVVINLVFLVWGMAPRFVRPKASA